MILNPTNSVISTSASVEQRLRQAKLNDAAQQFEGMFLQELLKPLQSSDEGDSNTTQKTDDSTDTLSSFGVEAVAKAIASRGGLGIADHVIRQINLQQQKKVETPSTKIHNETGQGTKVS